MDGELERDAACVADPVAHALREHEVVPVAGRDVRAGLRDADDRPARLELLQREAVVEHAFEVERRHVDALRIVEPGPRAKCRAYAHWAASGCPMRPPLRRRQSRQLRLLMSSVEPTLMAPPPAREERRAGR